MRKEIRTAFKAFSEERARRRGGGKELSND